MKVVKILWVDSCNSNMNWTIAEDIEVEPMYINSFGVIVKDTDEFLAIAQNYGDNPEQYSNITTIPKGCIKEIFVIHEDNVYKSEQKPVDKVEPKFKVGDKIVENNEFGMVGGEITNINFTQYELDGGGRYIPISHQDNYKLVEQKPVESQQDMLSQEQYSKAVDECIYGEKPVEWKQENVEELTDFENAMMHIGNSFFSANAGLDPNDTETVRSQADLLLELAQNPVEWSEEDENRMDNLCHFLEEYGNQYYGHLTLQDTISWFKSLRPQNRWKPSEEQMIALKKAMYDLCGKDEHNVITGLYYELEQLKNYSYDRNH